MGMKKIALFVLIFVLIFSQVCHALVPKEFEDFAVKNGTVKIDNQWRLTFQNDYLIDDNGQGLCPTHADMGLVNYGLINGLEFGLNYRQVYGRTETNSWSPDGRPHFNVRIRKKILGFEISDGTGIEYRRFETQKNYWEYRNNIVLRLPPLSLLKLQPYIAHNYFTNIGSESEFSSSGFSSGASLKLSKNIFSDFYYSWQVERYDNVPVYYKIFGTSLRFLF